MLRLPDDDSAEPRGLVIRLAEPVEDLNSRADRPEWVPKLVPEHRQELVLGAIRVVSLGSGPLLRPEERQDLLVLVPQALAHLQQDLQTDVWVLVHEASSLPGLDFEDDAGLANRDGSRAWLPFKECHLAECVSLAHDRERDGLTVLGGDHGFYRAGPDQEDRVAELASPNDHRAGFITPLGRDLVGEEPLPVCIVQAG